MFSTIVFLPLSICAARLRRVAAEFRGRLGTEHCVEIFVAGAAAWTAAGFASAPESARPTIATPPVEKTSEIATSEGAIQRIEVCIGLANERLERRACCAYVARAMREKASPLELLEREISACSDCPRLAGFLASLRTQHPAYWNKPVPGFGDPAARIVIVGLAPGMHGANRSGRPFFMDASGEWLYGELARRGLWADEQLSDVYIVNAVKCLPPANKPTSDEQARCRPWLEREFAALPSARVLLALGRIAHGAVLRCWNAAPLARHPFAHGRVDQLPGRPALLASYHPSRQNTNTGVLTRAMWRAVFEHAIRLAHQ